MASAFGEKMKNDLTQLAGDLKDKLVAYRRDFHRYPETGWTEFRTSSKIATILNELGYTVRIGADVIHQASMMGVPPLEELDIHMQRAIEEGGDPDLVNRMAGGLTGVVADMKCGPGPIFALRFDIDAVDICEAEDEAHFPFRENFHSLHSDAMHSCGHDGHAAVGLALAEILCHYKDQIAGTVRLIFQPAEEGVRGAKAMVDAGVLEGVEYILGMHLGFLSRTKGQLICGTENFLATTKFDIRFTGRPSHAGGSPEEGANALLAASSAALNLHAITRHSKGASRITVGKLEAGLGRNVIPPNALMKVETRGESSEVDQFMFESAKRVIAGAAAMYGVEHELSLMGGTGSGSSSRAAVERLAAAAEKIEYFENDLQVDIATMSGSEDFAHMMSVVQNQGGEGTYCVVGTELAAGHHDFYFDFDESCLVPAVELLASTVIETLS